MLFLFLVFLRFAAVSNAFWSDWSHPTNLSRSRSICICDYERIQYITHTSELWSLLSLSLDLVQTLTRCRARVARRPDNRLDCLHCHVVYFLLDLASDHRPPNIHKIVFWQSADGKLTFIAIKFFKPITAKNLIIHCKNFARLKSSYRCHHCKHHQYCQRLCLCFYWPVYLPAICYSLPQLTQIKNIIH